MSTTTSTVRCQACGGTIGEMPATAAPSPDGRSTWWLHRDAADCARSTLCRRIARANRLYKAGRIDVARWGRWVAWALRGGR